MWGREVNGLRLTFHLAGINNQNFLLRDDETGTYWQQISGRAISGPLAGETLPTIRFDELTFALWKTEQPNGSVLQDVAAYVPEYAHKDWDARMGKVPTVVSYTQPGVAQRDLMLGVSAFGAARAYRYDAVLKEKLVLDRVGGQAILLVVGPDNQSVRAFRAPSDFYRTGDGPALMMDAATGSKWNFQGCAIEGSAKPTCLEPIAAIKDYWFDWRHYHPDTSVWKNPAK